MSASIDLNKRARMIPDTLPPKKALKMDETPPQVMINHNQPPAPVVLGAPPNGYPLVHGYPYAQQGNMAGRVGRPPMSFKMNPSATAAQGSPQGSIIVPKAARDIALPKKEDFNLTLNKQNSNIQKIMPSVKLLYSFDHER
jgi:hypothetical protein